MKSGVLSMCIQVSTCVSVKEWCVIQVSTYTVCVNEILVCYHVHPGKYRCVNERVVCYHVHPGKYMLVKKWCVIMCIQVSRSMLVKDWCVIMDIQVTTGVLVQERCIINVHPGNHMSCAATRLVSRAPTRRRQISYLVIV